MDETNISHGDGNSSCSVEADELSLGDERGPYGARLLKKKKKSARTAAADDTEK